MVPPTRVGPLIPLEILEILEIHQEKQSGL